MPDDPPVTIATLPASFVDAGEAMIIDLHQQKRLILIGTEYEESETCN